MVHLSNGILLSIKEKRNGIYDKVYGTEKYCTEQGNPGLEREMSSILSRMRILALNF